MNVQAISQTIKLKHSQLARLKAQENEIIDHNELERLEDVSKERQLGYKLEDRRNQV